jgi:hypothetical protein
LGGAYNNDLDLFCFWGISIYNILERLVMKTVDVPFLFSFFLFQVIDGKSTIDKV